MLSGILHTETLSVFPCRDWAFHLYLILHKSYLYRWGIFYGYFQCIIPSATIAIGRFGDFLNWYDPLLDRAFGYKCKKSCIQHDLPISWACNLYQTHLIEYSDFTEESCDLAVLCYNRAILHRNITCNEGSFFSINLCFYFRRLPYVALHVFILMTSMLVQFVLKSNRIKKRVFVAS